MRIPQLFLSCFLLFAFFSFSSARAFDEQIYNQDLVSRCNQLAQENGFHSESVTPLKRDSHFSLMDLYKSVMKTFPGELASVLRNEFRSFFGDKDEYKYYYFLPMPKAAVLPSMEQGETVSFSTECFSSVVASNVTVDSKGQIQFDLTSSQPVNASAECSDFFVFATMSSLQFHYLGQGTKKITWSTDKLSSSELWDVNTFGIRILRLPKNPTHTIESLLSTLLLFESEIIGPQVNPIVGSKNVDFLRAYPGFAFPERSALNRFINISESSISSGDFIGITRMDGLDPMIAWGMGGATGHTTVALWFDDGLYVTESQVNSAYWPTNNIQRTPYQQWIKQAQAADYNFVHLPLSDAAKAQFNVTAAQQEFFSLEGTPYGYHNFLFGWIDTPEDNFPCLPPDYEYCLSSEAGMMLAGLVDRLSPAIGDKMYNQALMQRLGLPWANRTLTSTTDIIQYSYTVANINFTSLITMPEQDSWTYSDGKSFVCDVYVCSIWKAAGLFKSIDDQIQCTELTPYDVYTLDFFVTNEQRPEQCKREDPNLPYCQIDGKYQLQLPNYNTITPYKNMAQTCPSRPPDYTRPSNC